MLTGGKSFTNSICTIQRYHEANQEDKIRETQEQCSWVAIQSKMKKNDKNDQTNLKTSADREKLIVELILERKSQQQ